MKTDRVARKNENLTQSGFVNVGAYCIRPHVYQLKEYIKSFQREMSFPKPQRGDIFIETEKPKHTKLQRSDIESIRRLKIIRLKTLLIFNLQF